MTRIVKASGTQVEASVFGALPVSAAGFIAVGNAAEHGVKVDDSSFKCITEMTKVPHFYVDNLLGNLAQTVAVATTGTGDYPEGSVVQLMPNEVMIKQSKGFSPVTKEMFGALQRTDPRRKGSDQVSPEDAEALRQLGEIVKALTEKK
jgi:hypothetical protein